MAANQQVLTDYRLGELHLKNRVVLAPMTRVSATPDGLATEEMARYYASFAKGGFGLLITESVYTDDNYSQGSLNQPGLTNEEQLLSWKKVTDAVHQFGSKIIAQLAHAGALSQGNAHREGTVGPSAYQPEGNRIALYGPGGAYPEAKALSQAEIKEIISGFESAAERAQRAGFDGVEIHCANGFLHDQFLTPYTNQRTDEYGGSLENRLRFLIETIEAVKSRTGSNFTVGIRISQAKMNNYLYKWPNGEADAKVIFESLGHAGVDYLHVYEYNSLAPAFEDNPYTLAELARKYGNTTVIVNGGLSTAEEVEQALNQGGDLAALAKIALANPNWPEKVSQGEAIKPFNGELLTPTPALKASELLDQNEL
ncbi:NADH:flavin oxidoreductase [Paenibacillus yonginensis]|uniref:NADH:flavin oxidoreductase n=1 Tax=Paenibacillus yonginensis TaxID=1462996 RepID=A0A1B1MZH5_9BACL|nr:NADH:flavin oxidoreductase [Paenibacillus yonginensis]ANS74566.1 NADH:flavin oxidoreductase [Paenibacillus yonginensis]